MSLHYSTRKDRAAIDASHSPDATDIDGARLYTGEELGETPMELTLGRLVLIRVDDATGVLAGAVVEPAGELEGGAGTTVEVSTGAVSMGEL